MLNSLSPAIISILKVLKIYLYHNDLALLTVSVNGLIMITHTGGICTTLNVSTIGQHLFAKSLKCKRFMGDNCFIGIV